MKMLIQTLAVVLTSALAVEQSFAAAATGTAAPAAAAAAAPSAAGNPIANQPNPGIGMGVGGAAAPALMNRGPALPRANPGASVPMVTSSPSVTTFGNNQTGAIPGSSGTMRGATGINGFGNTNMNALTPGRGASVPGPTGTANPNSTFQPAAVPFGQNSQAAMPSGVNGNQGTGTGLAGLPASAFTTSVARPTPPGPTSRPATPTFFPLYLPDGTMNQYVGPNAPMANGQVNSQLGAVNATQAAQQNAAKNGMVFQNGQWWHQAPGGTWEFYRGNRWNSLPTAAGDRTTSTPTPTSGPSSATTASPVATPVYTYEVPAYSP
jgi:hypothetical protein